MRVIYLILFPNSSRKAISNNGFLFLGELAFYLYLSGSISCESLYYCCRHSNLIVIGNIENFSSMISNILIIFLFIFGGLSLIIIFVFIEKFISKEYPMFHFSLFKIKSFLGGNIAILLNSIARGDFIFLISLYLQEAFMNLSSVQTAIYLIPVSELLFIVLLLRSLLLGILFVKIL